jgi:hypothetical protein
VEGYISYSFPGSYNGREVNDIQLWFKRGAVVKATASKGEKLNQPYLGQKVSELRQQKGFTQEQLAEKCEVSPRTIQRIRIRRQCVLWDAAVHRRSIRFRSSRAD